MTSKNNNILLFKDCGNCDVLPLTVTITGHSCNIIVWMSLCPRASLCSTAVHSVMKVKIVQTGNRFFIAASRKTSLRLRYFDLRLLKN